MQFTTTLLIASFAALAVTAPATEGGSTSRPHSQSKIQNPKSKIAPAADDGFEPLLHGDAPDQFEVVGLAKDGIAIHDGEIRLSGKDQGYLATKETFHNYDLAFDWMYEEHQHAKPSDGNSGLLVHVQGPGEVWPLAVEVQIWYKDFGSFFTHAGGKFNPQTDDRAARDKALRPPGEWNRQNVTCRDGAITLAVNGVEYASGAGATPDRGQIGWMFEGSPIRFRNLRIKKLQ